MPDLLTSPLLFKFLVFAGSAFAILGSVIVAMAYRGREGQAYSPFNHFISELGEAGVSRFAWVFNLGLILTGICLAPAMIVLGLILPGWLAKIALVAGVVCALGLAFVGVFPMNRIKQHGYAAMTFFRGGLAMVILFSLAIVLQPLSEPAISLWYALAGLPAVLAFSTFLVLVGKAAQNTQNPLGTEGVVRPRYWALAMVEWSIFVSILQWLLLIGFGLSG